jgi:hypothetical protein
MKYMLKTYPKISNAVGNKASLAPIVARFEWLFNRFNKRFFESTLSKPVIATSSQRRLNAMGWFIAKKVWKDSSDTYCEINICPEFFNLPIEEVCEILLHEMVHLYNFQQNIQDCSRSGKYHNKKFKEAAERHGLIVEKISLYGFASTSLKPETLKYIKTLNLKAFDLFRDTRRAFAENTDEPEARSSTRIYVCPQCQTIIRATREVNVRCEDCDVLFIFERFS